MPRLDTLSNVVRQVLLSYPCIEPATAPWQPLQKELADCRLGLVTSAGLHLRSDRPFISDPKGGDTSYRAIPTDEDVDMRERPPEVPLAQFVRYCIDDLKAFYYEARMTQTEDPALKAVAYGLSR